MILLRKNIPQNHNLKTTAELGVIFSIIQGVCMSRSTDNVIRLVKAGGSLSINCDGRSTDNVLKIIKVANASENTITIRNLDDHSTDNVLRIIKASGDNILLEV